MTDTSLQTKIGTTIRISDERVNALLDELDLASDTQDSGAKPDHYRYRHRNVVVGIFLACTGKAQLFYVPTRLLSSTEIRFLHGGYVYPGVPVSVQLRSLHDTTAVYRGSVRDCEYVGHGLHELSVQFDAALDLLSYCPGASVCRILVVDDDPNVRRLAAHHLGKLNTEVDLAVDGNEGVEMALQRTYDLILMDINMPNLNGTEAMRQLREQGYLRPIVAFTGGMSGDQLTQLLADGFSQYLAKPFSVDALAKVVRSIREEPMISTMHDDESMADLINDFVKHLPDMVRDLEAASSEQDTDTIVRIASQLAETGTSFGYDAISIAASAILESEPDGQVALAISHLVRLVSRVRGTGKLGGQA